MFFGKSIDYGSLGQQALQQKSKERSTAMGAQAATIGAGLDATANTQASAFEAEARVKAAEAGADATKMQGIMDGLGALGGAFGQRGSMGKPGAGQKAADYTNKVDFGGGKTYYANNNGRLFGALPQIN